MLSRVAWSLDTTKVSQTLRLSSGCLQVRRGHSCTKLLHKIIELQCRIESGKHHKYGISLGLFELGLKKQLLVAIML